jgi:hypothetical protein
MKVETRKALGRPLDWMVAKALGIALEMGPNNDWRVMLSAGLGMVRTIPLADYKPSESYVWGGDVMDEHRIENSFDGAEGGVWSATSSLVEWEDVYEVGQTRLIASMRAVVAHFLGDHVEVPENL